MKKRIYYGVKGEKFVIRTYRELAIFVLLFVDTGKVEIRGKRPRVHESNPMYQKVKKIKDKFYA